MSKRVDDIFTSVAPRYDVTNSVLSMGIHHLWKRRAVARCGVSTGQHVLDCATGTGDLALMFARRVGPSGRVVGCDINAAMLSQAREKIDTPAIAWEQQDVQALTYADNSFDVAAIAYGIRNVDDLDVGLAEMARVVKPGGRVMVLEFGQPKGLMAPLYRFYSELILPVLGGLITGDRAAYKYLHDTSSTFPCGEAFAERMRSAGEFEQVAVEPLTAGISWLYVGTLASVSDTPSSPAAAPR